MATPAAIVNQRLAMSAALLRHNQDPDSISALAVRYAVIELLGSAMLNYLNEIEAPSSSADHSHERIQEPLKSILCSLPEESHPHSAELRSLLSDPQSWLAILIGLLESNKTAALYQQMVAIEEPGMIAKASAYQAVDGHDQKPETVLDDQLCPWLYRECEELITRHRNFYQEY